jgi:hypothetical protein
MLSDEREPGERDAPVTAIPVCVRSVPSKGVHAMPSRWMQASQRGRRRTSGPAAVEPLETRNLLSVAPIGPIPRHRAVEVRTAVRQAHIEATPVALVSTAAPAAPLPPDRPTFNARSKFVVGTASRGWRLTHSSDVRKVGLSYAKLTISHDTRKVGLEYLRAALRGNTKTLRSLGNTDLVRKVGRDFTQLGQSNRVKYVGNRFSHFGQTVANQFHRLFGPHH